MNKAFGNKSVSKNNMGKINRKRFFTASYTKRKNYRRRKNDYLLPEFSDINDELKTRKCIRCETFYINWFRASGESLR